MAKVTVFGQEDYLTPEALRDWLDQEKAYVELAAQRRIKEVTSFVEAYEAGKLTAEQANDAHTAYVRNWPSRLANDDALCRSLEEDAERQVRGTTRRERLSARSAERGGRS